jgi:hypothetical protein
MLIVFNVNDIGEMLISEVDVLVVLLLDASDLLSNDQLLEIDVGVLDLKVLLTSDTSLYPPLSLRLSVGYLLENLNLVVVEVLELLYQVVGDSCIGESWQFRMLREVLKVAEHWLEWDVRGLVHVLFSLLNGVNLVLVSLKELVDSLNDGLVKICWQVEHHVLLVLGRVDLEDLLEKNLDRLIRVKGHGKSQCGHKVVVDLNDAVVLGHADVLVELDQLIVLLSKLLH